MQTLKNFTKLITWHMVVLVMLSQAATYYCFMYGPRGELPMTLVSVAVIFPIVFSINAAYKRREEALRYFASLRASLVSLFVAHNDWVQNGSINHAEHMKNLAVRLLTEIKTNFTGPKELHEDFRRVYQVFFDISQSIEKLRKAGVVASDISRVNQYLAIATKDFEKMRNIYTYRTPLALRAYCKVSLYTFPILFAPHFAHLSTTQFTILGFAVALFYSVLFVGLDNIQERQEDPYDRLGPDDINLDVIEEYKSVMTIERKK